MPWEFLVLARPWFRMLSFAPWWVMTALIIELRLLNAREVSPLGTVFAGMVDRVTSAEFAVL